MKTKKLLSFVLLTILLLCWLPAHAGVMIVSSTPLYNDSDAMAQNLDRAVYLLNGKIIVKDQSFSFNEMVGPRNAENGFAPATNGNGATVLGGGVSQVATTLHMALKELKGDITYDELNIFGAAYSAGYVEQAEDAVLTDYARGLDYRFTSHHAENLSISVWRAGGTVFCQLTGIGTATAAPETTPEPEATPESKPVSTPTADSGSEYDTLYIVNVTSFVNLREAPSTTAKVLAEIPRGASVQFTGEKDGTFHKVLYDGKAGYIHTDYLSADDPGRILLTVINCNESVSLREGHSTQAKKLADIPLGGQVEYLGVTEDGFHKVAYEGNTGYVLATYLTEVK